MSQPSTNSVRAAFRGSRGAHRGGRGGGRGRGGASGGQQRPPGNGQPRPTHFLALPLDQHQGLRDSVKRFTDGVLASHAASPIPGVDSTIFQPPPRLHMTLGVMALVPGDAPPPTTTGDGEPSQEPRKTIPEALEFLDSIRPEILQITNGASAVQVPLKGLKIMNSKKEEAHVLWTGPGDTQDDSVLWKVCLLVHRRFKEAGFVTETRPLKLHCTIMNTTFRRPPRRFPFSFSTILERLKVTPGIVSAAGNSTDLERNTDFGTWSVDEVHLYKMGSWDKDRRYVSLGHISLNP